MNAILLSVRPIFARALLAGTKTAEVRRRFPQQPAGTTLYLYSSTPDRAVLGTIRLGSIDRPSAEDVWNLYKNEIQIDEGDLATYLSQAASAAILLVTDPNPWEYPVPLESLRKNVAVEPPQSFRYLNREHILALEESRGQRAALSTEADRTHDFARRRSWNSVPRRATSAAS